MTTLAFVLIKFKNHQRNMANNDIRDIKVELQSLLGVDSIYFVESNDFPYNAIAKVTTSSIDALYKIVISPLSESKFVQETTTMIVMDQ